ncbi:glutamate/aspartate:proton symporter GltP [Acerihabitans sp. KWT182]|uniref:Proton/glutamate-aspartate symporter n=1 Tax=Acerihabitans sp. KWT182 TaxID=3157919 RepID=A0AAU7QB26_9GAMM
MKRLSFSLAWQILIALMAGIAVGAVLHDQDETRDYLVGNILTPAGDVFIHLIKMIVVPIVISTLITGIAGVGDAKKLGKLGLKTLLYFEVVTTLAIILGITLANAFQPGHGIDMSSLAVTDISQYERTTEHVQNGHHGLAGTILSLIPQNIFAAMAQGDMLPIIFFSVLFGLGLAALPTQTRAPLLQVFKAVAETMFNVTHMIMRYAPVGVFALIAVTVANFGFLSLLPLAKLVLLVYAAIVFFALVVLGLVARLCGLRIWTLIRMLKEELILAYSTASSESVLPRIIEKMEAYGAPRAITSFVVPTGYSFNLDGSTLYQSIAAIFIAQLYGIELSLGQEIVLVLTLMVTSKGIAGVPGVSFVVLLATLGSVGIPVQGLAFIAGVDRILDMARTALNVVGNALAVVAVAKWENQFDDMKARAYEKELLTAKAPQPSSL